MSLEKYIKPKLLDYFLKVVYAVSNNSECLSRKTGCILIKENTIILEGWNSPPSKSNPEECERCMLKDKSSIDYGICTHAEANLIASAARFGIRTEGCVLLTVTKPCLYCSGLIVRAGISAVLYLEDYRGNSENLFKKANVELINLKEVNTHDTYSL